MAQTMFSCFIYTLFIYSFFFYSFLQLAQLRGLEQERPRRVRAKEQLRQPRHIFLISYIHCSSNHSYSLRSLEGQHRKGPAGQGKRNNSNGIYKILIQTKMQPPFNFNLMFQFRPRAHIHQSISDLPSIFLHYKKDTDPHEKIAPRK